jgi:hypothetical protein
MNTFWAIVANAMVIGGALMGGLLFQYMYATASTRVDERQSRR